MSNGRTSPVEPCLLVGVPRGHECRCSDLLSIQSKTDFAGVILTLWKGAGDCLRGESFGIYISLLKCCMSIRSKETYKLPKPAWY